MADTGEEVGFGAARPFRLRPRGAQLELALLQVGDVGDEDEDAFDMALIVDIGDVFGPGLPDLAVGLGESSFKRLAQPRKGTPDEGLVERKQGLAHELLNGDPDHGRGRTAEPFLVGSIRKAAAQIEVPIRDHPRKVVGYGLDETLTFRRHRDSGRQWSPSRS